MTEILITLRTFQLYLAFSLLPPISSAMKVPEMASEVVDIEAYPCGFRSSTRSALRAINNTGSICYVRFAAHVPSLSLLIWSLNPSRFSYTCQTAFCLHCDLSSFLRAWNPKPIELIRDREA
ncbi:hypothetical protein F5B17DRAFT_394576 [Nemania serpens]|nr:hypothetical protein F5B17DRAFT_394576 [Nemania serpens]